MPRGIYDRKPRKAKAAKKKGTKVRKTLHFEMDTNSIMAAQGVNTIKQRTELDVLADILADFESLAEDARTRVFMYFISRYGQYMPDFSQSS